MTAQEVIKKFMSALDNQNYSTGVAALDDAVRNSSRFNGVQDAINSFLNDQKSIERQAIKNILGSNYKSEYDGKQLEDLLEMAETDSTLKAVLSKESTYTYNGYSYGNQKFTAAERIRMETANNFLEECGIVLPNYCFRTVSTVSYSDGSTGKQLLVTAYPTSGLTGNTDTGAITGKDAGGEENKTPEGVVPEIGNTYTAKDSRRQIISTGTNDWIVKGSKYSDTIYSGGADSIDAGNGSDVVYVEGDNATIKTGTFTNDAVIVRENVKNVTLADLDQFDDLNVEGVFEVKTATLDKTTDTVTITSTSGRTLIVENWSAAKNSTVRLGVEASDYVHGSLNNIGGQKLGEWISSIIAYEDTSTDENISMTPSEPSAVTVDLSKVTSIGGSFSASTNDRSATYNASSTSGNIGTVSSEFTGVEEFTTHGLTVKLWGRSSSSSYKNVTSLSYDELTNDEKAVFAGLYKWWIKEGLKLNEESLGMSFTEDDVTKNTIKVFFYEEYQTDKNGKYLYDEDGNKIPTNTLAFVTNDSSGNLALAVNMARFQNIAETDEDGKVQLNATNTLWLDRTLAHELNHAILKANISNFGILPQFFTEGLAELVHGIDDERMSRIWDLAARNTTIVGTDTTVSDGTVRIEKALNLNNTSTGEEDAYAAGYMFLRYFAKKAAEQTENLPPLGEAVVNVSLSGENATYYADTTADAAIIDAVTTADSSKVSIGVAKDHKYTAAAGIRQIITATDNGDWNFGSIGDDMSIVSGSGADIISIHGTENDVKLGAGNNSIYAEGENNTITTGAGNDTVKIDYTAKNNTFNLGDGDNFISLVGSQNSIKTGAGNDIVQFTKYKGIPSSSIYLNTGSGNDSLNTNGYNNSIIAGAGDDTVVVFSSDSSIDGGDGADYFQVSGSNNIVNGGAGDDYFKISSGTNNIVNGGTNPIVNGGANDDRIYIYNSHNVINGDDGADYFQISGANNIVNGGAGDDQIYITVSDNTIYGGAGSDLIKIDKSSSLSDFTIADINYREDILFFNGVIGSIEKISDGIKVNYKDSNISVNIHFPDTDLPSLDNLTIYDNPQIDDDGITNVNVKKLNYYVSMQPYTGWKIIDGDAYYYIEDERFAGIGGLNLDFVTVVDDGSIPGITIKDHDIIVDENLIGDNIISFESDGYVLKFEANGNSFMMGTSGNDTISVKDTTFEGSSGLTAYTFGGKDTVSVNNFTLKEEGFADFASGADEDSISVSKVNQSGDTILQISGDASDDNISISQVTQGGGIFRTYGQAGDDTISISDIELTDRMFLAFSGNSDSLDTENNSGNDVISAENIKQNGGGYFGIAGDDGADTISVKNATVNAGIFVVEGDKNSDSITVEKLQALNSGTVSIFGGAGDDTISVKNATFSGIYDSIYSQVDGGAGMDIISVDGITLKDGAELAVTGGDHEDNISFKGTVASGSSVLITGDDGANTISVENTTVNGELSVVGGNVNDNISVNNSTGVNIISGNGNDIISVNNSTGININSGEGNDILSFGGKVTAAIYDFSANDTISLSSAVSEEDATFADGVLKLGNVQLNLIDVTEITKDSPYANTKIINGDKTVTLSKLLGLVYWEINGTTAKYGDSITVSGISSNAKVEDFEFDGDKTVTISANALDTSKTVSITGGTLALADDVTIPITQRSDWTVANGTAKYMVGAHTEGYVIENNQIKYQNKSDGNAEITVNGLSTKATKSDITKDNNTVILKANALDTEQTVTINSGYMLALDDGVTTSKTQPASWDVKNGTAKYMVGAYTAGYALENNQIVYKNKSEGNAEITVTGLKTSANADNLSLSDGKVVTIFAAALDKNTVTITGGTLALAADVEKSTSTTSSLTVKDGTATYFKGEQNAGYVIRNNQIEYQDGEGETKITINGLSTKAKSTDITLSDDNVVTIAKNALDSSKNVSITGGTLALGKDVTKSEEVSIWKITKEGNAAVANYLEGSITEGYAVEGNKIVHKEAKDGTSKIKVSGLKSSVTVKQISLDEENKVVSLAAAAVQGEVEITAGYALEMGKGTYSKSTVVGGNGANTIYNAGNKLVIDGGAGNDYISLASGTSGNTIIGGKGDDKIISAKGKNIYQYASGDGDDVIEGFSETDTLQITSGEIKGWSVDDLIDSGTGGDLTFYVGNGSITIKDGAGKKINTAIGTAKAVANIYTDKGILNDKQTTITLRDDADSYTVPSKPAIKVVDGSATKNVEIIGSTAANSIVGGAGNDTIDGNKGNNSISGGAGSDLINGGAGNDKIFGDDGNDTIGGGLGNDTLTGGKGADVFVYTGGNDFITDYAEEDKISLGGEKFASVGVSGKDLTLKIGKNTLKVKEGVGKKVTIDDKVYIFEKGVTYNGDKSNATVTAAASLESNVAIVDGSSMSSALKYAANNKDNLIYGGKGADSILGSGGHDTIFGNAGNDKLFGDAGNDVLDGGAGNDTLTGGTGNNTLTGGVGSDIFVYEGGNDLITDYESGKDKIQLSTEIKNAKVNGEDVIFTTADGKITVEGGTGKKITTVTKIDSKTTTLTQIYELGMTYNDKQTAVSLDADFTGGITGAYEVPTKPAIATVDASNANGVEVIGSTKAVKIFGSDGNDTLTGGTAADSIYGGKGADLIDGGASNDKLFGDDGNDTISGGLGNDTLTGGNGKDLFVYSGGNDVIADYTEEDKISIGDAEIASIGVSGKDVTLKIGKNTLKIKEAVGKKVTIDKDVLIFEKGVTYDANKTNATVTAAASLESSVMTVDGSAMSAALKYSANDSANLISGGKGADSILGNGGNDTIYGNAGADKLYGDAGNDVLYGGLGNDTLWGGAGNDTLTGDDGNDMFIFESGNDTINDYAAGKDKIKFVEEITNYSVSGEDVIFTTASGKVTVKDGAGQKITTVDYKNKTANQMYPAASANTIELLYDCNFMTDDSALDEITEQKFEVQNIETQNGTNLEQNQTILTYGEDK